VVLATIVLPSGCTVRCAQRTAARLDGSARGHSAQLTDRRVHEPGRLKRRHVSLERHPASRGVDKVMPRPLGPAARRRLRSQPQRTATLEVRATALPVPGQVEAVRQVPDVRPCGPTRRRPAGAEEIRCRARPGLTIVDMPSNYGQHRRRHADRGQQKVNGLPGRLRPAWARQSQGSCATPAGRTGWSSAAAGWAREQQHEPVHDKVYRFRILPAQLISSGQVLWLGPVVTMAQVESPEL